MPVDDSLVFGPQLRLHAVRETVVDRGRLEDRPQLVGRLLGDARDGGERRRPESLPASGTPDPEWPSQAQTSDTFSRRASAPARIVASSRTTGRSAATSGASRANASQSSSRACASPSSRTLIGCTRATVPPRTAAGSLCPAEMRVDPVECRRRKDRVEPTFGERDLLEPADVKADLVGIVRRRRATATMFGPGSTASTRKPHATSSSVSFPVPDPTSTTREPGPRSASSTAAATISLG